MKRIHSQFADIKALNGDKPLLYINYIDAGERNIKQGDRVEIYNDKGKIHAYACITDNIKSGVVNVYEGLSDNTGASVNILTCQDVSDIL